MIKEKIIQIINGASHTSCLFIGPESSYLIESGDEKIFEENYFFSRL